MHLRDWFQYSDREKFPYNPTTGTSIIIEKCWGKEISDFNSPDWRREEWLIHSALVPIDQLDVAAITIESPNDLNFEMGWTFDNRFMFGNCSSYDEIQVYPLAQLIKNPISQEFNVDLIREFIIYHALEKRNESQYYHPVDDLLVAETKLDFHEIYDPTANVRIHRDYLRDFLAALDMGLLISLIAERCANSVTADELEIDRIEDKQIDQLTYIGTSVHTPEFTHHGCFRGRSVLRQNFVVKPYDRPKFERSPWYHFGKAVDDSQLPSFIVNDEGHRESLTPNTFFGKFGYLYFRSEVLQKYIQVPGYNLFFHMRHWGVVSLPGNMGTIDVGINSHGLVNAFSPDIADLNVREQNYWASYSSLPSGEVCEELFSTRIEAKTIESPGVVKLIRDAKDELSLSFKKYIIADLFSDIEPSTQHLSRLSVGVIGRQFSEVFELGKILYQWVVETMQVKPLREILKLLGSEVDKNWRQIKILEKILMAKGLNQDQARKLTAPLVGLNELRIGSAHIGNPDLAESFKLMGTSVVPETPRLAWDFCVDSVIDCLSSISRLVQQ